MLYLAEPALAFKRSNRHQVWGQYAAPNVSRVSAVEWRGGWFVVLFVMLTAALLYAQEPPREVFCASAGELGLAGESPVLMVTVFERGSWRPAAAYVEPENVTFLLVPALTRNDTDLSRAVARAALPPPVLRNDTVVCFEAAPGTPSAEPPAPGVSIAVEKGKAKYHVFVARAADVENLAYFNLAWPGRGEGKRPDRVERVDRRKPPRAEKPPEAKIEQVSPLAYWAAFKLYRITTRSLPPGGCVETYFDVPEGTGDASVVLTGGTTPGVYSYVITYVGTGFTKTGSVTVYQGSPQTVVTWLGAGRATYKVRICNQNSQVAAVYASALVRVANSQYFRNDVIRTTRTYIPLYICNPTGCVPLNEWLKTGSNYLAVPGFYVDAASGIVISVYLRVPKRATSGTLYVYWGGLYIGSIVGQADPRDSNYVIFSASLTVPQVLYPYLLPTYGLGGAISLGPLNDVGGSELFINVGVRRPMELSPAGDGLYRYPTKIFKESLLVVNTRAFIADLEAVGGFGIAMVISTKPFESVGQSSYTTIRMTVKALDSGLNPVPAAAGTTGVVVTSGSSWMLETLPWLSLVLSIYDLAKSTIDALKGVVQTFPAIGYVTLLLDRAVQAAAASVKVTSSGNAITVELYTGWYNDPLAANVTVIFPHPPTYVFVSRLEYSTPFMPNTVVYSADGAALPFTTIGSLPQAGQTTYFPYRTLTCGAQEYAIPSGFKCVNEYFR